MPKRSIVFSIICAAALVVFIFIGLYPNYMAMKRFKQLESDLETKVKIHDLILPVYMKLIERIQIKHESKLFLPDMKNVQGVTTQELIRELRNMARSSGIKVQTIIPDAASYSENPGKIKADASFKGNFKDFYPFLNKIGETPFIEKIERFEIITIDNAKILKLRLSFIHNSTR